MKRNLIEAFGNTPGDDACREVEHADRRHDPHGVGQSFVFKEMREVPAEPGDRDDTSQRPEAECSLRREHRRQRKSREESGKRWIEAVSYTHLRAHETPEHLVCRLLL